MRVKDYICRNYLKIAATVNVEIKKNHVFLVSGDQLLRQAIALAERDYSDEEDQEAAINKAVGRLIKYYKKEEGGI